MERWQAHRGRGRRFHLYVAGTQDAKTMQINDKEELTRLVKQVLLELLSENCSGHVQQGYNGNFASAHKPTENALVEPGVLPDLAAIDLRSKLYVDSPANAERLLTLKKSTPARICVGRTGTRYKTETMLRFLADHAAARDAVYRETPEQLLKSLDLEVVQTQCHDKDEYLTRPDLGRKMSSEGRTMLKNLFSGHAQGPDVAVFFADGLSTTAIDVNGKDTYLSMAAGLKRYGFSMSEPFLVKYGRVPIEDEVAEISGAKVVAVLIGERPGLVTAESMSVYMAYKATVGMDESRRTLVSNIHKNGTPAVEAGAYIADIIKVMLEKQISGVDLKL